MCSGTSRRASRPAWTPGCRVLTRPSRISGKPVRSVTGWTSIEASSRARRVPPVEYRSWPSRVRPRAKAGRPALLWTERRALLGKDLDRFRQDTVLLGLDAGTQGLDRVVRQHGYRSLKQNRPRVDVVGDQVDGAARGPDAAGQGALHRIHASREGGQERRVDVDDAARECRREARAQDSVIAGIDHQLYAALTQPVAHRQIASLARVKAALREPAERQAELAGELRSAAAGPVGGHGDDVVVALDEVPEVRSLAAGQNSQTHVRGHLTLTRWLPPCSRTRPTTGRPGSGPSVTSTMPSPMLNVLSISSSAMRPRRAISSKTGGTDQAERSSSAARPSGSARWTFPSRPPPVM